ncbi:MAG: hypothetical protein HQL52_00500 [Magnetococcales bacterium]|nr:hypothetical protein [Magnetococcales bacterium]
MGRPTQETWNRMLGRLQEIWTMADPAPFELELKRIEVLARDHRKYVPVRAYYLLGLIAALKHNPEMVKSAFKNALVHSSQDDDVQGGYAACLARLGHYSESRLIYKSLFKNNPKDLDYLAQLITTTLASGRIQEAMTWIEYWSRLSPRKPFDAAAKVAKKCQFLQKNGISDDAVEALRQHACQILEREGKSIKVIQYLGHPEHDPTYISADLVLDEPEEVVEVLNNKLKGSLAKAPTPPKIGELIVFGFTTDKQAHQS